MSIESWTRFEAKQAWAKAHKERSYMGLTQVCQLIRQEFRPLYLGAIKVYISPRYIPQYLSAFGLDEMTRTMGATFFKDGPIGEDSIELMPILRCMADLRIELNSEGRYAESENYYMTNEIARAYPCYHDHVYDSGNPAITSVLWSTCQLGTTVVFKQSPQLQDLRDARERNDNLGVIMILHSTKTYLASGPLFEDNK